MDPSRSREVGRSFLEDVSDSVEALGHYDREYEVCKRVANQLEAALDTLKLARQNLESAPADDAESVVLRWREVLLRGQIHKDLSNALELPAQIEGKYKRSRKRHQQQAQEALSTASDAPYDEIATLAWWHLGWLHASSRAKEQAIEAFRKVEVSQSSLAIEASKAIQKLESQKSACFIATAAWGDEDALMVRDLRRYRDDVLVLQQWGQRVVAYYEYLSPPFALFISHSPARRRLARLLIAPIARMTRINVRRRSK